MEYKIGDRFEVLLASNGFGKGEIITLQKIEEKGYYFKGSNFYYTLAEMTGSGGRTQFIKYIEKFTYEIY